MVDCSLTTTDLAFGYDHLPVLYGLNLQFKPGSFHAVVGPNGSGKSTLLGLLTGHFTPDTGRVLVNKAGIDTFEPNTLSRLMALVPQDTTFNFPFTVFDTVLMGRHPHIARFARPAKKDLSLVHQALTAMELDQLAGRTITELSGGERQRTVFARALAQDTPCLLLDEPTSSMDIRHALAAMAMLRDLAHRKNRTIIAVLHDLNLAAAHCDRVTVLEEGTVHASGSPENTLTPETIRAVFGVKAHVRQSGLGSPLAIEYEPKDPS